MWGAVPHYCAARKSLPSQAGGKVTERDKAVGTHSHGRLSWSENVKWVLKIKASNVGLTLRALKYLP